MSRRNSFFRNSLLLTAAFCLGFSGLALAQGFDGQGPGGGPGGPGGDGFGRPPMERAFHGGQWWNDSRIAQQIGLSEEQKKQMSDIFLQHRLKLIDLNAALEKQETLLRPMVEADQPDEAKVLSQIDAVAQARADLEKANARMLFDLRKALTPEQWQKMKALRAERRAAGPRGSGKGGPGMWRQHGQGTPPQDGAMPPPPGGGPGPQ